MGMASYPVSATLRVDGVDAEILAQVRARPAIAAARVRRTVFAVVKSNGEQKTAELYALDEFEARDIGKLESERGTCPPRDDGIVIESPRWNFPEARRVKRSRCSSENRRHALFRSSESRMTSACHRD